MTRFRMFGEIEKVQDNGDGTLTVSGVVSTETPDSQGDVVLASAMKAAIPDYLKFGAVREMHQPIAAGTALSMAVDENGVTRMEALVVDESSVKKVNAGVLKGFSIGGSIPKDGRDPKNKRRVTKLNLTEVSLVDRPANPDAVLNLAKFQEIAMGAEPKQDETVEKGMFDVCRFADILASVGSLARGSAEEAVWEKDNSPIPAALKGWLGQGLTLLQAMTAEEAQELLASLGIGEEALAAAKSDSGGQAPSGGDAEPLHGEEPKGEGEPAAADAVTPPPVGEDVEKAGGRSMTKAKRAAIQRLRKAQMECAEALKAFDDLDDDEEADKGADSEAIAKLHSERDELETMLKDAIATGSGYKERIAVLETELAEKSAALLRKGVLRVVPVEKAQDGGSAQAGAEPAKESTPTDPLEAMRKVHAAGGMKFNPLTTTGLG